MTDAVSQVSAPSLWPSAPFTLAPVPQPRTWPFTVLRRQVWSDALMDPDTLRAIMSRGFAWVRPVVRPWAATLRAPTMGRLLEISSVQDTQMVRLDSRAGQRLIRNRAVRS